MEPEGSIIFKGKIGSDPILHEKTITNNTSTKQCFKVKCTDNDLFRVRPPLGFVEPGEKVWNPEAKPQGVVRAYCVFECEEEKTEEKKENTETQETTEEKKT